MRTDDGEESLAPSVTTDLDDYQPGATATITAEGFAEGDAVTFEVDHVDGPGADSIYGTPDDEVVQLGGDGHDPWTVVDGGEGDLDGVRNGAVITQWYVNPDDSLDERFLLTASSDSATATATFTDSPIVFEKRVADGGDDVEERASDGRVFFSSSDLELVDDKANNQLVGIRFTDIGVPQGAVITNAYIQFKVDERDTGVASLQIRGEDTDDAAAFSNTRFDVSTRLTTSAVVLWEPDAWTDTGASGIEQRTPDLSTIVQEIVDRSGWATLNDVVFVITGAGERTAESFNGDSEGAPLLHIEYTFDTDNIAPELDLNGPAAGTGYTTLFTDGGAPVAVASADVTISDPDNTTLDRALITLTNPQAGDRLVATGLPPGISVDPDSTDNSILLIGVASLADYQAALQAVFFENTGSNPDPTPRTVEVVVNDGILPSSPEGTTINIDRLPEAMDDLTATQVDATVTTGDVLANDDRGDAPAVVSAFDTVSANGGSVSYNGDGTFDYTPPAGFIGDDTFGYTIADQDNDTSSAVVTVTVTDVGGGVQTFETRVATGSDDVEQRLQRMSMSSSDLELVDDGSRNQVVGTRFTSIDVPQGAIIVNAYIEFQVDETNSGPVSITIAGEDIGDAAPFQNIDFNLTSRTFTDATVDWFPPDWSQVGSLQRTPDISAIVQEIVDRGDWSVLNDMVFSFSGNGERTAEAFEGDPTGAPLLHIEYLIGTANEPPALDLDSVAGGTGYVSAAYEENGPPVSVVGPDVVISDSDDTELAFAVVTISNPSSGDRLLLTAVLPAGITLDAAASSDESITLVGTASLTDYQTALQAVGYENTGENPGTTARQIEIIVHDGIQASKVAVSTVAVDPAPDPVDDAATTQVDTLVTTGNVIANDDEGDGPAIVSAFDAVSFQGGTVVSNGDGTFDYTPPSGFIGADSFLYTIADTDGDTGVGTVSITVNETGVDPTPRIVAVHDTAALGIPDPSGLAYNEVTGKLLLSDSEIDESPFFNPNDIFEFNLDGTLTGSTISVDYTKEVTGVALDIGDDLIFMSDDDKDKVNVANLSDPGTLLYFIDTTSNSDVEDVDVDAANNRLWYINGNQANIVETAYDGTVISTIDLPSPISDPEAIVYDPLEDIFFVAGGFSESIWKIDADTGAIVETIDLMVGTGASIKGLELAPASDGSGQTHLYVADYGVDQVLDGRLFELSLGSDELVS